MRQHALLPNIVLVVVVALGVSWSRTIGAQGRTASEKPVAPTSKPAPAIRRLPDGHPDIRGEWGPGPRVNPDNLSLTFESEAAGIPIDEQSIFRYDRSLNVAAGLAEPLKPGEKVRPIASNRERAREAQKTNPGGIVDPPGLYDPQTQRVDRSVVPWTPAAAEAHAARVQNNANPRTIEDVDTVAICMPNVPGRAGMGLVLQSPDAVTFITNGTYRVIPLDGRPPLDPRIKSWVGDSRGRWDGDTLVVEVANFNGLGWFDFTGFRGSDAMRIVERFKVVDRDLVEYTATITDPKTFTKPVTLAKSFKRKDTSKPEEIWEDSCYEGNRYIAHVFGR